MSTNLVSVVLLGFLAGGVSCAAMQGGLLAGLVSRSRASAGTSTSAPVLTRLGDDLAPVGAFLVGKVLSHAVLGLLLGALGTTVRLSLHGRALIQVAAGLLIIAMGLGQLGVRGFTGITFTPPASWTRLVRGRARSRSAFAPAVLGLSSVLIPCGVTLSVMALSVASGSAWRGALIMAAFVVGTAPLFTLLGYAAARARRAAGAWRKGLAAVTGVVVLGMGVYTLNGGLELSGSPVAASRLASALGWGGDRAVPVTGDRVSVVGDRQTVVVTAVEGAYVPADLQVRAGLPTVLVVRSEHARGCVRALVIPSLGVEKILPVNGDTEIDLGVLKPGSLDYSCSMGMYTARLTVTGTAS